MPRTGDDHLERAQTELGEPELLFRISRQRFLAKLSLGLLLIGYGIVANYYWWLRGPATIGHLELLLLFVPPLSGVSLLWHMYRHRGLHVLIYPTGLLRLRRGEVLSFPWSDIDQIRVRMNRSDGPQIERDYRGELHNCWLPVDSPTFKLGDAGLTVVRTDGEEAHFGPALTDYEQLAEEVQKRTFTELWPRLLARFNSGERIDFGELTVTSHGLEHAGKRLPWRDVKELVVAQGKLSVKQAGKWLPWALVEVHTVPNPHLLFAVADEAQRHFAPSESQPKDELTGSPDT